MVTTGAPVDAPVSDAEVEMQELSVEDSLKLYLYGEHEIYILNIGSINDDVVSIEDVIRSTEEKTGLERFNEIHPNRAPYLDRPDMLKNYDAMAVTKLIQKIITNTDDVSAYLIGFGANDDDPNPIVGVTYEKGDIIGNTVIDNLRAYAYTESYNMKQVMEEESIPLLKDWAAILELPISHSN